MPSKPANAYSRNKRRQALQGFASDLQKAVDAVVPTYKQPYRQVAVILFSWSNDDIGVGSLENDLAEIFLNTYNFHVERFRIPTANAYHATDMKFLNFSAKWAGKDSLRIYVYSGHAEAADPTSGRYFLAGAADGHGHLRGPRMDWFLLRGGIENTAPTSNPNESPGDILYILDSCSAGAAGVYDGPELLAACGWNDIAGVNLAKSFTQALINKLRELNGNPETVAMIFSSLFREATDSQVSSMPVHISQKNKDRSITLSRLPRSFPLRAPESFDSFRYDISQRARSDHRVLISVELQDDVVMPELHEWIRWLTTNVPSNVLSTDITIHTAFKGSSTLLLTVPVEVWTMMPDDKRYYNFVSHVGSELSGSRPSSELPLRPAPPTGRENQPPPGSPSARSPPATFGSPSFRKFR